MDWRRKRVLVTGGASFIGSHVIDELMTRAPAHVRVVDDLSSGTLDNIEQYLDSGIVEFVRGDLLDSSVAMRAVRDVDVIFHLAAIHGGRGYVDLHQTECAKNLVLDGILINSAHRAGVEKLVFASSGCIYPSYLQQDTANELYLTEDMAGPPYDADHMYGWAKLMTEMTLKAYHHDHGLKSASCRFFTVYGERGVENHAVMAMIARAFVGENPFEVWGDGTQVRNWTYVGDIASGMVLAAERIDDASAINLGTMERTSVIDAVREVLRYTGHVADIKFLPNMPTGPLNRVADNRLAKHRLGWEPRTNFYTGLHRTIDWYFATKDRQQVRSYFRRMLTERGQRSTELLRVRASDESDVDIADVAG